MRSTLVHRIALAPLGLLLAGMLTGCPDDEPALDLGGGDVADVDAGGDADVVDEADLEDTADLGGPDADVVEEPDETVEDTADGGDTEGDAGDVATPDASDADLEAGDVAPDADLEVGDAAPDAAETGVDAEVDGTDASDADAVPDLVPDVDATPDLTPDAGPTGLSAVGPFYASAPNWNDWVEADGTSTLDASDTPCVGTLDYRGIFACIPGGMMRSVTIADASDCTGVSASDDLGAFDWTCYDDGTSVRVVSTGLRDEVRLADLMDFGGEAFRRNSLDVSWNGISGPTSSSTAREVWWDNDVVLVDETMVSEGLALLDNVDPTDAVGTIYLLDDPALGACLRMSDNRTALVIDPELLYYADCPDSTLERVGVLAVQNVRYGWIEGRIDGDGPTTIRGIRLGSARYTVVRHVEVFAGLGASLAITGSDSNLFEHVYTWGGYAHGIGVTDSDYNLLRHIYAGWPGGIYLELSRGDRFEHVTVDATANILTGLRYRPAFTLLEADGVVLSDVTLLNAAGPGLHEQATSAGRAGGHVITNLTVANARGNGVLLEGRNSLLQNVVIANSGDTGLLQRYSSENNTVMGSASAHSATWGHQGERLDEFELASDWYFTGPLLVGNNNTGDCEGLEGGGLLAGCANDTTVSPASDAVLTTDVTLESSFVGPVSGDTENLEDVSGTVAFDDIDDFVHFESQYRGWSPNSGRQWPFNAYRGACEDGNCRVFDWSLVSADSVLRNVNPEPTGSTTADHFWVLSPAPVDQEDCDEVHPGSVIVGARCRSTYLRHAVELLGDRVGNDNGLCESNEDCLFTPNLGSYQGHGPLVPRTTIVSGAVTGVTLYEYLENGR